MFEKFTKEAHRVVTRAVEEAEVRGDSRINTEHLLLGVSHTAGLGQLGLSPEPLRRQLDRLDAEALEAVGIDPSLINETVEDSRPTVRKRGHIPFTEAAKHVLKQALREAIELKHRYIGVEHIALALTTLSPLDRAVRVLDGIGLDPAELRVSLIRTLRQAS